MENLNSLENLKRNENNFWNATLGGFQSIKELNDNFRGSFDELVKKAVDYANSLNEPYVVNYNDSYTAYFIRFKDRAIRVGSKWGFLGDCFWLYYEGNTPDSSTFYLEPGLKAGLVYYEDLADMPNEPEIKYNTSKSNSGKTQYNCICCTYIINGVKYYSQKMERNERVSFNKNMIKSPAIDFVKLKIEQKNKAETKKMAMSQKFNGTDMSIHLNSLGEVEVPFSVNKYNLEHYNNSVFLYKSKTPESLPSVFEKTLKEGQFITFQHHDREDGRILIECLHEAQKIISTYVTQKWKGKLINGEMILRDIIFGEKEVILKTNSDIRIYAVENQMGEIYLHTSDDDYRSFIGKTIKHIITRSSADGESRFVNVLFTDGAVFEITAYSDHEGYYHSSLYVESDHLIFNYEDHF